MTQIAYEAEYGNGALDWMLRQNLILKKMTKDPETHATIQAYILSEQLRETIGSNLVRLVAKVTKKGNGEVRNVSLRDAFLTATIAALLETTHASLDDDEMTSCANIVFALLPIWRLEETGLAGRRLRSIARKRSLVGKLQELV
jgi:hypothetical protein